MCDCFHSSQKFYPLSTTSLMSVDLGIVADKVGCVSVEERML